MTNAEYAAQCDRLNCAGGHIASIASLEEFAREMRRLDQNQSLFGLSNGKQLQIPTAALQPAIMDWITVEIQKHKDALAKL